MKKLFRVLKTTVAILAILLSASTSFAQESITQTIRGQVLDQDSRIPLIGVNVIILGSDPFKGTITDLDGYFRLEEIPVGRVDLQFSFLGYEKKIMPNVLVVSGKEIVLEIDLAESVVKIDAEVKATKNRGEANNEMTAVSGRQFSVEETKRYAGSFADPARMASGFAGVVMNPDGNNDIVVRGNSPKGVLWRMEGVEIQNPNHFGEEGGTGGPISALNPATLSNSDFLTGAFSADYGNATSGIFDIKLRNGNNETNEYAFSVGILGTDVTAEGPLKKGKSGSYLLNYRYSTLDALENLGFFNWGGIPKYQDATLKVVAPTQNMGVFTLFGIGGISGIRVESTDADDEQVVLSKERSGADFGMIGLRNSFRFSDKVYMNNTVSMFGSRIHWNYQDNDSLLGMTLRAKDRFLKSKFEYSTVVNYKMNAQHSFKAGATYSALGYNMESDEYDFVEEVMEQNIRAKGNTGLVQGFANWKFRITEELSLVNGIHYTQLTLNNSTALEPRIAARWQFARNQALSAGFGVHSRMEAISIYMSTTGGVSNEHLDLGKARHYVLGYENMINKNLFFKSEIYYQELFDVPVDRDATSSYSILNQSEGFTTKELVNNGTGTNYGVEFTLEKYFHNSYYFLATTSLYQSKYVAADGIERNTRYNGNYAGNLLIGKEFQVGDPAKKKTIAVNTKFAYIGGKRRTPIDRDASIQEEKTVWAVGQDWAERSPDVFRMDLAVSYRRNRAKSTHTIKLDIMNVTNNEVELYEWYDTSSRSFVKETSLPMVPNLLYRIEF
jgi:hypothetical protein